MRIHYIRVAEPRAIELAPGIEFKYNGRLYLRELPQG